MRRHLIQRGGALTVRCRVGQPFGEAGMTAAGDIKAQLELVGLDEALRLADAAGATPNERARLRRRVEVAAEIMSEPPGADELGFLHSGLCQCYLPRTRPAQNSDVWARRTGRFRLLVEPGTLRPDDSRSGGRWVPISA